MRSWISAALSEDGLPSASRLVMFSWSAVLLLSFVGFASWEAYHTGRMPDVSNWGSFLGFAQAGGAIGYVGNQLRAALKKGA